MIRITFEIESPSALERTRARESRCVTPHLTGDTLGEMFREPVGAIFLPVDRVRDRLPAEIESADVIRSALSDRIRNAYPRVVILFEDVSGVETSEGLPLTPLREARRASNKHSNPPFPRFLCFRRSSQNLPLVGPSRRPVGSFLRNPREGTAVRARAR